MKTWFVRRAKHRQRNHVLSQSGSLTTEHPFQRAHEVVQRLSNHDWYARRYGAKYNLMGFCCRRSSSKCTEARPRACLLPNTSNSIAQFEWRWSRWRVLAKCDQCELHLITRKFVENPLPRYYTSFIACIFTRKLCATASTWNGFSDELFTQETRTLKDRWTMNDVELKIIMIIFVHLSIKQWSGSKQNIVLMPIGWCTYSYVCIVLRLGSSYTFQFAKVQMVFNLN